MTIRDIYADWKRGKVGFSFLPDPAEVSLRDYEDEAACLLDEIYCSDIRKILTDEDRAFYDALPDRFRVYRGGHGTEIDKIAAGVCWTTSRPVAEWFANRTFRGKVPMVLSASVCKARVRLAFASEFEVVLNPGRHRVLACPISKKRPPMGWLPGQPPTVTTALAKIGSVAKVTSRPATRARKRAGRCYELAYKALLDLPDDTSWRLIHGVVNCGHVFGHAWLEREGEVFDAVRGEFFQVDQYRDRCGAVAQASWTRFDAAKIGLAAGHYGPWLPTTAGAAA